MKAKIEYIDVARGIAILLVVLGHAITKEFAKTNIILNNLRFYVYVIHMPIFFILSSREVKLQFLTF